MNGKVVNQKQDSSKQDWQISKFTSVERAKHLLETGLHADCEFLLGDGVLTPKELIRAHQIFLAMSSPVFEVMFYGTIMTQAATGNKNEPITIPDLTPSSFRDLLQYIYTDSLILLSMGQAICLCYAAKKYIFPDLVAKCVQYMLSNLSTAHACRVLEFSKLIDDEHLKTKCLTLLREKTQESLIQSGFEDLSESTVLSIVKDGALNINELELFVAVIRWAEHQCTQRGYGIKRTAMRHMLGDIINEIRFLSMTSEEFASTPVLSGILEEKECMAIFMNLNNPGSLPMPLHLSSSKTQRSRAGNTVPSSSAIKHGERSTKHNGIYCVRQLLENRFFVLKDPTMDRLSSFCSTTLTTSFTVSKDITVKGFIIAEMVIDDLQVLKGILELEVDCHLLDYRYSKVASAINRISPPWTSHPITLEAVFGHSIRVKRNMKYRISISFNRRSHFLLGMASPDVVSCQGVQFHFSIDDSARQQGDLIRGVIFDL